MDLTDFQALTQKDGGPMIRARSFIESTPGAMGTLLYGYTCQMADRDSADFHVYLKDGLIHRLLYRERTHEIEVVEYDAYRAWYADRLIPDKRVCPESTTRLMGELLKEAGVEVPYTRFNERRYERLRDERFHALTFEEIPR